jgi:hypothetical protein
MKHLIIIVILISLAITGCSDIGDCFHGTGKMTTEERIPGRFHGIYLTSNIDVILHFNRGVKRLQVHGGDNLTEGVETKIENGILRIKNTNRCNWVRNFKHRLTVEIWTDTISTLYMEDATGDVFFEDTLHTENFRLDAYNCMGKAEVLLNSYISTFAIHNGPMDITAKGIAVVQYNYHSGYGIINCKSLYSNNTFITNKGTNDTYVSTTNLLEANIQHSGNIFFTGEPDSIKSEITGSGKLIKI